MHTHRGRAEKYERLQAGGCRALATICWGGSAVEELDGSGSIEAVFESLRRYPDCPRVQENGLNAFVMYRLSGGRRIDNDFDGFCRDVVLAGLAASRRHSQEPRVLRRVFDVFTRDLGPSENEPCPANWMLPLLGTPENLALLRRSAELFQCSDEDRLAVTRFVAHMTHGACAGCDKLQETKMQLCARCRRARFCSADCQRKHWPVHKPNCVPSAAAGAA
jgi:hypothetical protein